MIRYVCFLLITGVCFYQPLLLASESRPSDKPSDIPQWKHLEDYLEYAALHNAQLKAAFAGWQAAVEQVPQVRALPDPKFNYGYFIREVETRVGPQRQKFELTQMFPWFGVLEARGDAAAAQAKAAYQRYEAQKLKLFAEVKNVFYEYDFLAKAVRITRENLKLLTHFEEIARIRYATSTASHPDIIRAQIELAILEDRLHSLLELRPALNAKLNSVLNRDSQELLPWPKSTRIRELPLDMNRMHTLIQQHNPNLKVLSHEIAAAKQGEILARKQSYPDIQIGIGYIDTAGAIMSGVDDSGKDPIVGMVSLSLPIWNQKNQAAKRQARARMMQKTHEKAQLQYTLAAQAQELCYEHQDRQRKIKLYRDAVIPKARDMLLAAEATYQSGAADFLTLLDAQQTLLLYQLHQERAAAQSEQILAQLEMLIGTELPFSGPDQLSKPRSNIKAPTVREGIEGNDE